MIKHWEIVFFVVGVFLISNSWEKASWLIFSGEAHIAKVIDISSVQIRQCGRKDILCTFHLTDSYAPGYVYHLKVGEFIVTTEQIESVFVGKELPVIFSEKKPSLVHVIDSKYQNVYLMFFGGIISMLSGLGFYILKAKRNS